MSDTSTSSYISEESSRSSRSSASLSESSTRSSSRSSPLNASEHRVSSSTISSTDTCETGEPPAKHRSQQVEQARAEKLYEGAELSVFNSFLLIFQFAIRHSLTGKAFSELLQLLAVHLPPGAKHASSVYAVKQFFLKLFPSAKAQQSRYCGHCHRILRESDDVCSNQYCTNKPVEKFLTIPIAPQLKTKLEGEYKSYGSGYNLHTCQPTIIL